MKSNTRAWGAMGVQAAAALRGEPVDIRLVIDNPVAAPCPDPDPDPGFPLGVPAIAAASQAAAVDDARRAAERAELLALRVRVAELEADIEHLRRDTERRIAAAVEKVERRQTADDARTMRGRVPSITRA